ncbi:MAG: outer membrane beta-barrel protein [Alphaproteobacteria bacterium]
METGLSQSGYFGGGSVPPSLQPDSRLRIGDFALSAQTAFGMLYDDNVDADDDERDEDVFLTLSPSVRAQSIYARHSLGFGAGATAGTALKDTGDDFFDWRIGADGRIDLSRKSKLSAAVGYTRDVEDDEDIDAEDASGDTPIHNIDASLGYDVSGERVGFGVGGSVSRRDVEGDDFADRDRTAYGLNASVRYKWSEDLSISGGPAYRYSTFDEDVADDGDSRDAEEYSFQIGAGYRASRTISTRAAIGYSILTFEDPDRDNDDSATGSAGLTWAPGNGTTLDLEASRSLGISIADNEDARTTTSGSATLAHSLSLGSRSAITSSLGVSVTHVSDLDRTDKGLVAGLTYGYRLAEHAVFTASYRFSQRDSEDEEADYYRNLLSVGVTVSY